jgi:membrane protease YdiL (CAAX protease family)
VSSVPTRHRPVGADLPRTYPALLRGPDHHWWRPLASLTLAVVVLLAGVVGAGIAAVVVALLTGGTDAVTAVTDWLSSEEFTLDPAGFLTNNLLLAALVPSSMIAVWVAHRWRPRWLGSVRPGLRWGWLVECAGWSVLLTAGLFGLGVVMDGLPEWSPEPQLALFVGIMLLTTPLQAAGEEYAFRGLITQAIGSWFPRGGIAAVVGGLVSATLFALAHGTQSPWLFGDRFAFGAAASYVVWRTGGLEASIALHTVNNLAAIGIALASGTLAESITATDYPPLDASVDIAMMACFAALVTWRAHRLALVRVHDPALQPDRHRHHPLQPPGWGPPPPGWAPPTPSGWDPPPLPGAAPPTWPPPSVNRP